MKRDLIPAYFANDCLDAMTPLDELMSLIVLAAARPIDVCSPDNGSLSDDEVTLLQALRAVARGELTAAGRELTGLITSHAAGPFCHIAAEFLAHLEAAGLQCTGARKLPVVEAYS